VYDFNGESFPNTPKYQATADLEQRFPFGGGREVYLGGSVQYRSSASGVFGRTQSAVSRSLFTIDSYALFDLRAGVRFDDGKLTAELWGRNITDKFYVVGITRTVDTVARYTGTPATYGARLSWRY
jgi:outer membrane receptor protein involved in Fe transport